MTIPRKKPIFNKKRKTLRNVLFYILHWSILYSYEGFVPMKIKHIFYVWVCNTNSMSTERNETQTIWMVDAFKIFMQCANIFKMLDMNWTKWRKQFSDFWEGLGIKDLCCLIKTDSLGRKLRDRHKILVRWLTLITPYTVIDR